MKKKKKEKKKKHIRLSEQFQNQTSKSQKEIQSMDLANKYMTDHFPGLV
jgi:hypothetical protein